ncbi:hypothetical protein TcasGA2_TC008106 [Tribolium castaneum]|uniref:Uncharacterized protein n=1 Tax=Tribolium castaneum TaxID=7070 RepID=D1ZZU0_TRICA|nr:hypothetical protein TcasGA2_TC008106 [Tribolium castaneum]
MKSMIAALFVVLALASAYAAVIPLSAGVIGSPLVASPWSGGLIASPWLGSPLIGTTIL